MSIEDTIVQYGEVTHVSGDVLTVMVSRPDACNHCAANGACNTLSFGRQHSARARNRCDAKLGDHVEIVIKSSGLLKSAALVYLFPAMMLLIGALTGNFIAQKIGANMNLFSVLSGLGAFVLSVVIVYFVSSRPNWQVLPEAVRISDSPICSGGDSVPSAN
ncbi:MAG: SoxR reducing system RseC family protein [Deltaproteobacteria bacterium]|nr:SoxR reducing system RseC family protein [Deltaproteobacteria bacterium]